MKNKSYTLRHGLEKRFVLHCPRASSSFCYCPSEWSAFSLAICRPFCLLRASSHDHFFISCECNTAPLCLYSDAIQTCLVGSTAFICSMMLRQYCGLLPYQYLTVPISHITRRFCARRNICKRRERNGRAHRGMALPMTRSPLDGRIGRQF